MDGMGALTGVPVQDYHSRRLLTSLHLSVMLMSLYSVVPSCLTSPNVHAEYFSYTADINIAYSEIYFLT